jgi:hypothetical protein
MVRQEGIHLSMANLTVKIGGDARQFRSVMKGLKGEAMQAGKSIGAGLIGPLAGVGATAGLIALGKSALQAADNIGKGAARIGISTDEYQRLQEMANRTGGSIENVETAITRMTRVLRGADQESKQAQLALADLGMSAEDLAGLDPGAAFRKMSGAVAGVQDPMQRLAIAQEVFGRGAAQIMPLIQQYEAARVEVEQLQNLMSGDAIRAAEAFNDSIAQLGSNIRTEVVNSGLLEWLAEITGSFDEIRKARKLIEGGEVNAPKPSMFDAPLWAKEASARIRREAGIEVPVKPLVEPIKTEDLETAKAARAAKLADEAQRKANAEKARQAAEKAKADTEAAKLAEAAAKAAAKGQEATDGQISDMEHRIALQRLLNAGLEREAAIEDALRQAKERNAAITGDQLESVRRMAGELFDLKEKPAIEAEIDIPKIDPVKIELDQGQTLTDLERIGGVLSKGFDADEEKRVIMPEVSAPVMPPPVMPVIPAPAIPPPVMPVIPAPVIPPPVIPAMDGGELPAALAAAGDTFGLSGGNRDNAQFQRMALALAKEQTKILTVIRDKVGAPALG